MLYSYPVFTCVLDLYIMQWLQANKKNLQTSVNLSHCQRHCVHISLFYSENIKQTQFSPLFFFFIMIQILKNIFLWHLNSFASIMYSVFARSHLV